MNLGKKNSITMKRNILHISFHMLKEIITYKSANFGVYISFVDLKNENKTCSDACLNILNKIY